MAVTLATVIDRVLRRFSRADSELESLLETDLIDYVHREICSQFPYWFLTVPPGYTYPNEFPTTEAALAAYVKVFGDWLDRGWLHVQAGQAVYYMAAPAIIGPDGDTDPTLWTEVQIQEMDYLHEFNLSGSFVLSMPVHFREGHFVQSDWSNQCQPRIAMWETGVKNGKRVSWLRFNPTPENDHIYAVQFKLRESIKYDPSPPSGDISTMLLDHYPEVAIQAGMLYAAEYFNEVRAIDYYRGKLWGVPNDARKGKNQKQVEGSIARMKRDTSRRNSQAVTDIPQFLGCRGAVGRGGYTDAYRRRGVYYQDVHY